MEKEIKKLILTTWALSVIMHIFAPIVAVYAASEQADNVLTVDDQSKYKIEESNTKELKVTDKIDNNLNIKALENNKDSEQKQETFNGIAYLVWSDGDKILYKKFTDLNVGEKIFYFSENEVVSDTDSTTKFNVHADTKFWSSQGNFESKKPEIDKSNDGTGPKVNINDLVGPDGIDYMPVGEPKENNAYVSYADRNFKAIIYNNKFKGLQLGNFESLTYYPGAWSNALTRRESFDISDTTKESPVVFDTVLIESSFKLKASSVGDLSIKSIEPLDVPEGAVTISKVDNEYKFDFASRFYNKVVFKLTDTNDHEYYFMINRQAMNVNVRGDKDHPWEITSELYFDRNKSWEDYEINARILYKDGSTKIVKMENAKLIGDGLGNDEVIFENDEENPVNNVWPKGKGLKRAVFKTKIDNSEMLNVDKIYLNVEFTGSTDSKYAGNYAGSGKGEVIDMTKEEYQRRMK